MKQHWIAFAMLITTLLAGCGGAGAAAPSQLTKVRVVYGNPNFSRITYFIAQSKGFFTQEGLEVDPISMSGGGVDAAKMMATNQVDFFVGQVVDAININKAGVHVQGVALLTNRSTNGLVIRKDLADKVKTFADVKGPNYVIGVSGIGSGSWQFTVYVAQLQGVSKDELNIVAIPPAQAEAAMKAGRLSLATAGDPNAYQMILDGVAERFVDLSNEDTHRQLVGPEYINDQITVSESYIKAHPKEVQAFVNALQRALNWLNSNSPEDVATELRKTEGFNFDQNILVGSLQRMSHGIPKTAVISKDAFDSAVKLPVATGALDAPLPFDLLVDNQFADKAAKSLGSK